MSTASHHKHNNDWQLGEYDGNLNATLFAHLQFLEIGALGISCRLSGELGCGGAKQQILLACSIPVSLFYFGLCFHARKSISQSMI